ncbi:hypothetical protein SCLARK_001045 [Spiroplasma clarkii]|uniref:Uncharacterized protein n=1 Tax=Spiroplasma clarkii TaxID=2139 RepID=A0A1Y0L1L2_9MOLU|nr:hypothetical protein [Spiroplasma clarkii]ARU91625.1 hypothetical protein SCLARK_001045 [Spiroplasma clarkii]ATX71022.1 hypothetical protein SCLAR_v1c07050 [Spiroplasma clarkii]
MKNCEIKDCKQTLNPQDPKRIYVYDENLQEEIAMRVCDQHYKEHIDEENDVDWQQAIDSIEDTE